MMALARLLARWSNTNRWSIMAVLRFADAARERATADVTSGHHVLRQRDDTKATPLMLPSRPHAALFRAHAL